MVGRPGPGFRDRHGHAGLTRADSVSTAVAGTAVMHIETGAWATGREA
jgi:hypothetical protein